MGTTWILAASPFPLAVTLVIAVLAECRRDGPRGCLNELDGRFASPRVSQEAILPAGSHPLKPSFGQ